MKFINAYSLPELAQNLPPNGLSVAIDVLRATTTITTALANGAERVLPFETVKETFAAKRALLARKPNAADSLVLGGERGGLPIEGFDLGNSPDSYVRERVENKTVLFTTTNGTKAILSCRGVVLLAAFINANAVAQRITRDAPDVVSIVCAGTNGRYTEEDMLLAGLLVERLASQLPETSLNVQAEVLREFWRTRRSRPLVELLRDSIGGRNLKQIGLAKDVADAARRDALDVVPEFRVGEIKLDSQFKRRAQ